VKRIALLLLLGTAGCNFSPLMNRIEVGQEPFVVVVGEGADGRADLFAVSSGGGEMTQLTYTTLLEVGPRLTPEGALLGFIRMRDTLVGTPREVVVMNLLNGSERRMDLPEAAGHPQALGWSDDQATLYVQTDRGRWALAAPPADPSAREVPATDAAADTALTLWLGTPRFARAIECGTGVCAVTARGDTASLAPAGRDPMRWGNDSVAWFVGERLMVRSLGPGLSRRVEWTRAPTGVRDGAYAAGVPPVKEP
jgi:hypothetical protein